MNLPEMKRTIDIRSPWMVRHLMKYGMRHGKRKNRKGWMSVRLAVRKGVPSVSSQSLRLRQTPTGDMNALKRGIMNCLSRSDVKRLS